MRYVAETAVVVNRRKPDCNILRLRIESCRNFAAAVDIGRIRRRNKENCLGIVVAAAAVVDVAVGSSMILLPLRFRHRLLLRNCSCCVRSF